MVKFIEFALVTYAFTLLIALLVAGIIRVIYIAVRKRAGGGTETEPDKEL